MALTVEPEALRAYAARLAAARAYAETARNYVSSNGNFSAHETGLIGYLVPHHRTYMDALTKMLDHLAEIADASGGSMRTIAKTYEGTDKQSAESIDASYPEVARPSLNHEPHEPNYPPPSPW